MMQAMIRRRFTRLQKEREEGAPVPDLILIDGGKGQLSSVMEVMEELGVDDVAVAAVAKGPDRDAGREVFYMPGKPPIRMPMNDPVLYYLQRIRDEAHRFAITGHRAKRAKQMRENPLDEIDGVGATRKSALLKHFGSAKAVSRANLADLEAVEASPEPSPGRSMSISMNSVLRQLPNILTIGRALAGVIGGWVLVQSSLAMLESDAVRLG